MRIEDMPYFMEAKLAPSDWESKFDRAKFLKCAGGPFMTIEKSDDKSSMMDLESDLPDHMPAPKRQRSSAAEEREILKVSVRQGHKGARRARWAGQQFANCRSLG
jgi:hypothetical protein